MKNAKTSKNASITNVIELETIKSTMDYMKYPSLDENRPLDESHLKRLGLSFSQFNNKTSRIIVVKTKAISNDGTIQYLVIDGNHTRHQSHRMGLPLNVVIVELDDDTRLNLVLYMAVLNNSNKAWSNENYLNGFAKLNIYEYKRMLAVKKETGLTVTDLQYIFLGRGNEKNFKSGLAVFPDEKNSQSLLDATMKIKLFVPNKSFTRRAFYKICENTCQYDKFADAIIKTSKHLKKGYSSFSENEKVFYVELLTIYKNTFK